MNLLEIIKDFTHGLVTTVQDFFEEDVTYSKKTFFLITALCTAVGIIGGFLIAPIKKGIYFNFSNNGSNNGNTNKLDKKE